MYGLGLFSCKERKLLQASLDLDLGVWGGAGWISRGLTEPKCVSMSLCISISFLPSQTSAFHIPNDTQTAARQFWKFCVTGPNIWRNWCNQMVPPFQIPREEKLIGPAGVHCIHFSSNHLWPRRQQPIVQTWRLRFTPALLRMGIKEEVSKGRRRECHRVEAPKMSFHFT